MTFNGLDDQVEDKKRKMSRLETRFTKDVGIEIPLICGAMYPCSNPELVAAVSRAGGHAGEKNQEQLYEDLSGLDVPLICAGGIGCEDDFIKALDMGYAGVQMGTRFIATTECRAHKDYKMAIVDAHEDDIVLTDKISGVPVAVIKTPYIEKAGTKASWLAKKLLRHPKGKHYMRMFYTIKSIWQLKEASLKGISYKDFFQAGKSVSGIETVEPLETVIQRYATAARQ